MVGGRPAPVEGEAVSFISRILGHTGDRIPFDVEIRYENGTVGTMPIWGLDMRDVLRTVDYWLPQQVPATSIMITARPRTGS